jgi:hypothetical protein
MAVRAKVAGSDEPDSRQRNFGLAGHSIHDQLQDLLNASRLRHVE